MEPRSSKSKTVITIIVILLVLVGFGFYYVAALRNSDAQPQEVEQQP